MNFFALTKLGRTLLLAAVVAVGSVCWLGCGGDDNPSGGDNNGGNTNNSGNNNGNATHTHDWGDWTVTTPATCDAEGVETRTCKLDASHKETRTIPKLTGAACNGGGDVVDPNTVVKGMFTDDRNSQIYKTVKIGSQTWMAQNLNIELGNSWCSDDDESNCIQYGRLYDWETAKTVCPTGWKLPDTADWNILEKSVGFAGTKLKSTTGWNNDDNGTDDYGFSALPSGNRNSSGTFHYIGERCWWWTVTEYGSNNAYYRGMENGYNNIVTGYRNNKYSYSVRCVKDE